MNRDNRKYYYSTACKVCANLNKYTEGVCLNRNEKICFDDLNYPKLLNENPVKLNMVQTDVMSIITQDVSESLNPLVINPTGLQACGEWDIGTDGFEESIAYRSTLSMSLRDSDYPIPKNGGIYSPTVYALRGSEYQPIKSFTFSVFSLSPLIHADFSIDNDRKRMTQSIDSAFQMALKYSHKSLIFNTFGCKEDNNPIEIAQLFGNVISEYSRSITRVTIIFDFEINSPNLLAFKKYLRISLLPF